MCIEQNGAALRRPTTDRPLVIILEWYSRAAYILPVLMILRRQYRMYERMFL